MCKLTTRTAAPPTHAVTTNYQAIQTKLLEAAMADRRIDRSACQVNNERRITYYDIYVLVTLRLFGLSLFPYFVGEITIDLLRYQVLY